MRSRPLKPAKRANGLLKTSSRCDSAIHRVQALPNGLKDPRREGQFTGGDGLTLSQNFGGSRLGVAPRSRRHHQRDHVPRPHSCASKEKASSPISVLDNSNPGQDEENSARVK